MHIGCRRARASRSARNKSTNRIIAYSVPCVVYLHPVHLDHHYNNLRTHTHTNLHARAVKYVHVFIWEEATRRLSLVLLVTIESFIIIYCTTPSVAHQQHPNMLECIHMHNICTSCIRRSIFINTLGTNQTGIILIFI